jgi:pimeloyl-ACP methyl ester carboxylesterase
VARARIRSRRLSVSDALIKALPHITARIGGIWGEHDVTGGGLKKIEARAELFRSLQPDAPFDIIKGSGHWVMYEAADRFSETLLRHLGK